MTSKKLLMLMPLPWIDEHRDLKMGQGCTLQNEQQCHYCPQQYMIHAKIESLWHSSTKQWPRLKFSHGQRHTQLSKQRKIQGLPILIRRACDKCRPRVGVTLK